MNIVVRKILEKREEAFDFAKKCYGVGNIPRPDLVFSNSYVFDGKIVDTAGVDYLPSYQTIFVWPVRVLDFANQLIDAKDSIGAFDVYIGNCLVTEYSNHIISYLNDVATRAKEIDEKIDDTLSKNDIMEFFRLSFQGTKIFSRSEGMSFFVGNEYYRHKDFPHLATRERIIKEECGRVIRQNWEQFLITCKDKPGLVQKVGHILLAEEIKTREQLRQLSKDIFQLSLEDEKILGELLGKVREMTEEESKNLVKKLKGGMFEN